MNEFDIIARSIYAACGGVENIHEVTCCATRLRLKLKNLVLADEIALKKVPLMHGLIHRGSEFHLVFGAHVVSVYKACIKLRNE